MAEAIAAIGLIANVAQFIELGTRVARRLDEMRLAVDEAPRVFRPVQSQVPLLVDTLQRLKEQSEQGKVAIDTQKALMPVIDGCLVQVGSVDELIGKTVPLAGDSSWQRNRKALARSVSTKRSRMRVRFVASMARKIAHTNDDSAETNQTFLTMYTVWQQKKRSRISPMRFATTYKF